MLNAFAVTSYRRASCLDDGRVGQTSDLRSRPDTFKQAGQPKSEWKALAIL